MKQCVCLVACPGRHNDAFVGQMRSTHASEAIRNEGAALMFGENLVIVATLYF